MIIRLSFSLRPGLEHSWTQKNQDQLRRFITASFLDGMLAHLRKVDVLSLAEQTKIKEAGGLPDQVDMLTTIVTSKDTQGSDILLNFIENSESQEAQLILNHGKQIGFPLYSFHFLGEIKILTTDYLVETS